MYSFEQTYVRRTDFLITTSVDGHLKLWKKQEKGIEFVKHYRAHVSPIVGVSASADGQLFASISDEVSFLPSSDTQAILLLGCLAKKYC